ncbi:hypothetical protein BZA70DRAFT_291508 [Myxozyma melibiosi]|uniref:Uncharacterized protein n=1 Tax=Myxozyma melibiosi TaxID=54550 RepID=A0ABR1EZX3_9ASCO
MEHLNARIDSEILAKPVTAKLPHQLCGDALEACELMITKFGDKNDQAAKAKISSLQDLLKLAPPASASELVTAVFSHPAVPVGNELLRRYFLLRPDTDRAIGAMRAFYQNPANSKTGAVIEKETFMIPFRKTLREEDVDGAFKILDLTAASPQWLSNVKRQWGRAAAWWAGGFLATIQLSDLFVTSDLIAVGGLEGGFVVKTLVGVYLVNSTLLGLVACASRPGDNGGRVSWRNGVFQNKWYLHAQESRMLSQIVDMDQLRLENDGEVSARVLYELDARQRRLSDNADDIMLKEYWAKQGQGFEWVEPDIDPAEEEKIARDNLKRKTKGIADGHHERMQEQYIEGEQDDGWIQRVLQKDM